RAALITLQQMIGHALRRLGADPGQAAQCLDQFVEAGRRHRPAAQNGSFMPGGRFSPAVTLDIFSWVAASTLRTASLSAAATRSSSISRSSMTDSSMDTRRTSYLQVICTLTMPAPDCPSTSI